MNYILTVLLFVQTANIVACDCKILTLKQVQQYGHSSRLIFIGDVHSIDRSAGTYSFIVVEILKGETFSKIIKGRIQTSCRGYPDRGRWIVYADTFDGTFIDFSSCGPSRSFHNPERINAKEYAILPAKEFEESELPADAQIRLEKRLVAIKGEALNDLQLEIRYLRKRR
jgi:transposase-like protein